MTTPRGRRCSICNDSARVQAVDAALIAGNSVAEVVRLFSEPMGFSEAAAYRHARHAHEAQVALSVPLPDGERPVDNARVLVRVQRHLLAMLDRAEAKNDDKTAALAGDRLRAIVHESNDILGFTPKSYLDELDGAQSFVRSVARLARADPTLASQVASGFRSLGDLDNADDLDALAQYYSTHRNN